MKQRIVLFGACSRVSPHTFGLSPVSIHSRDLSLRINMTFPLGAYPGRNDDALLSRDEVILVLTSSQLREEND